MHHSVYVNEHIYSSCSLNFFIMAHVSLKMSFLKLSIKREFKKFLKLFQLRY